MMTVATQQTIKSTARLAGGLHLLLLPFAVFSFAYVPSVLMVRGDAVATCTKIMASERLFRASTISHLISQVLVVVLALTMYRVLESVHQDRARLMVALALLGVPISFVNEVNNLTVLQLLGGVGDGVFSLTQLQGLAMLHLDKARNGVLIAQILWGCWLLVLGSLVFRSGFLPRLLGVCTLIAGTGYLIDSSTQILFPGRPTISQFTFLAEMALPGWLLLKGVSIEEWQRASAGYLMGRSKRHEERSSRGAQE